MSSFEVKVVQISAIESIYNCDNIELAVIGDYRSVVRKNQFNRGDLVVYIPEGAIVPQWIITKLGFKLAGPDGNRVKAMKLRGVLSQGITYPVKTETANVTVGTKGAVDMTLQFAGIELENGDIEPVLEGDDVTTGLGITKWNPPIPVHMAGEVFNAFGYTLSYDIENIKKFPDIFKDDNQVFITEKLHGTWTCFGFHPDIPHPIVTSKGLSAQGLAFKFNTANENNLYIRSFVGTADEFGNTAIDRLQKLLPGPFYILGETYGKGVQDLTYGLDKPHFRAFDIYLGKPGEGCYISGHEFKILCHTANIETVPVLYHGPYSKEQLLELTNGNDNINGTHMREGIVVRPYDEERYDYCLGRVILKSVSEAYLLRKNLNATEYN
jgi:RNA ligase (TIGR02306 family)